MELVSLFTNTPMGGLYGASLPLLRGERMSYSLMLIGQLLDLDYNGGGELLLLFDCGAQKTRQRGQYHSKVALKTFES